MNVNVAGIRRSVKNLAHNYTDAQVRVREATSNDPWGPSSTLMSEIADLTYNVVAFSEIMQMIWKRLNDHGKNWRHVYKALVLLEYLIKTGTEKVAQQCKENIFAIQTLKDFQYIEDNKDQGINVREKAKQLVALLKDDERLKNERVRALKAKERFAQSASGIGSDSSYTVYTTDSFGATTTSPEDPNVSNELESARPQTAGEEELQLQLALAMSREEADQEEQRRRNDDVRLQIALSESKENYKHHKEEPVSGQGALLDLLDVNLASSNSPPGQESQKPVLTDPWGVPLPSQPTPPSQNKDPWGSPVTIPKTVEVASSVNDPWAPAPAPVPAANYKTGPPTNDPWSPVTPAAVPSPVPSPSAGPVLNVAISSNDPWTPVNASTTSTSGNMDAFSPLSPSNGELDEFDILSNRNRPQNNVNNNNSGTTSPFDMSSVNNALKTNGTGPRRTPESFLGENSSLVNLQNLIGAKAIATPYSQDGGNPFAMTNPGQQNPFHQPPSPRPSMNQLKQQQVSSGTWGPGTLHSGGSDATTGTQDATYNPFFS